MYEKLITTKILITVIDTCANTEALANLTDATKLSNYSATMKTVTLSEIRWMQTSTKKCNMYHETKLRLVKVGKYNKYILEAVINSL